MNVGGLFYPQIQPFGLRGVAGNAGVPFGGFPPVGGSRLPFHVGVAPPIPVLLIYGASGKPAAPAYSLEDSAGNLVSVGSATDSGGATVLTASLNTTRGGIIGFQSAPPSGLTLDGKPPATPPRLPAVSDSQGAPVPYGVAFDQYGGAVLSVNLTDQNGRSTTFYSQVDSLGYPIGGGPAPDTARLPAFSTNPALTENAQTQLPASLQPFATPTAPAQFGAGRGTGAQPSFGSQTGQTSTA
jgi:hypothetical protein